MIILHVLLVKLHRHANHLIDLNQFHDLNKFHGNMHLDLELLLCEQIRADGVNKLLVFLYFVLMKDHTLC
jgi:hypothetical protein